MLTGLDPHSSYMNAKAFRDMQVQTKGEFGGLGIEVTQENGFIKVISPIDDTPASKAGIKAGDIITALNGKTVQGLSLQDAVDKMRGAPNSKITLTIKREGVDKPLELSMRREIIHIQVVKQRMEPDNIGYVRLSQFTEQADAGLKQAVKTLKQQAGGKLKALILDLRNNPGGLLDQAVAISGDFIDQGEIVSTRARHAEDAQRWDAKGSDILDGAPLVVLINGGSASASEIVAGALQDHHRAVLLGTRSFGKGSVQTVIPLPGNGAMRLTTARYYTPSGRSIQGLGIVPDVPVAETREETPHFGPEREADLNHVLKNQGGTPDHRLAPRTDLPPIAKEIPSKPPEGFPKFDPAKPVDTDFQLQQALVVAKAMAAQNRVTPTDLPVLAGPRRFFAGWRGLGRFWLLVAVVVVAGGVTLQLLGPAAPRLRRRPPVAARRRRLRRAAARRSRRSRRRSRRRTPARRPRPGRDTPGPIADPDPALLEPMPGHRRSCCRASPSMAGCRCRSMPPGFDQQHAAASGWPAAGGRGPEPGGQRGGHPRASRRHHARVFALRRPTGEAAGRRAARRARIPAVDPDGAAGISAERPGQQALMTSLSPEQNRAAAGLGAVPHRRLCRRDGRTRQPARGAVCRRCPTR